jgi:hypothetical protein
MPKRCCAHSGEGGKSPFEVVEPSYNLTRLDAHAIRQVLEFKIVIRSGIKIASGSKIKPGTADLSAPKGQ